MLTYHHAICLPRRRRGSVKTINGDGCFDRRHEIAASSIVGLNNNDNRLPFWRKRRSRRACTAARTRGGGGAGGKSAVDERRLSIAAFVVLYLIGIEQRGGDRQKSDC